MYVAQYRPTPVRMVTRDEDGVAGNNTGDVTVTVLDATGTTVATGIAANDGGNGTGAHAYIPPTAVTNTLGSYTVRFTYVLTGVTYRTETPYIVYGQHLFEIADLRAHLPELADQGDYPAANIRAARDAATERLERAAQVALSTRATTVNLDGTNSSTIVLPNTEVTTVTGVDIDGDTQDLTNLVVYPDGRLTWDDGTIWTKGDANITIDYEHGFETTPDVWKRAAILLAVEYLVPSALPQRAMSQSTDLGEFRISIANPDAGRWTGIPEVDAIISEHGRRRPVVA